MNADERRWGTAEKLSFNLRLSACICGLICIVGCSHNKPVPPPQPVSPRVASVDDAMELLDRRDAWTKLPDLNFPRYRAEIYLKGLTIVLDPGHGGSDGGNISIRPTFYQSAPRGEKEAVMSPH